MWKISPPHLLCGGSERRVSMPPPLQLASTPIGRHGGSLHNQERGGALSRYNPDPSSACGSWAIYATVPSPVCGSGRPSAMGLEGGVIRHGWREAGQGQRMTSGSCTLLVVCNRRRTDHDYADYLGEIAGGQLA